MMKVALMMYDGPLRTGAVLHHNTLLLYCGENYRKIRAVRSDTTVEKSGLQIIHQSATTIMSSQDSQHLHALLNAFDAERLGEGDPVAGANLLVAMACSLAAIQKPGCCLTDSRGSTVGVGTNLIVSGPLSAALIEEKVLAGLARRQDNLVDLLRRTHRRNGETVDDCMHTTCGTAGEIRRTAARERARDEAVRSFGDRDALSYTCLVASIREVLGLAERAAKGRISTWLEMEVITRDSAGAHRLLTT